MKDVKPGSERDRILQVMQDLEKGGPKDVMERAEQMGVETGFQIRSVRFGSLPGLSGSVSGSDVWPSAAVYGAYRSGRFQVGPEVTATVWRRATATIGLHVAYVLR